MTIGVGYKTDKYFVCFTDIQLLADETSLHSNSCKKVLLLHFGKHHGVIYAAGDGDATDATFVTAATLAQKHRNDAALTLDSFVQSMIPPICEYHQKREEQIIHYEKSRLTAEQKLFDTVPEQKAHAAKCLKKIMKKIKKDREEKDSYIKLAFYDGIHHKPRVFSLENSIENDEPPTRETFDPTTSIGIGEDSAEIYFSLFGRQLYADHLRIPDILCITAGAYNYATLMRDVEGTPHVCIIDKDSARILPHEESAILANASAAHSAELLNFKKERAYAQEIYAGLSQSRKQHEAIISHIATDFISTTELKIDISLAAIKLGTWGEIATRKIYKSQK